MTILPRIVSKVGQSIKLAKFLRNHPMKLEPFFKEIRKFGDKYVSEMLGPSSPDIATPTPSPTSSLSTTSIPESSQGDTPGSTPRLLTPTSEQRNSLATDSSRPLTPPVEQQIRTSTTEYEAHESEPPNWDPLMSGSVDSRPVPLDILRQAPPLISRPDLMEPPPTAIPYNQYPPEDQHGGGGQRGTSCKESLCCIVL